MIQKRFRTRTAGAAVAAAVMAMMPAACVAQDNPYQGLKAYDFQSRKPVAALQQMIRDAHGEKARFAQIETGLVGVLKDPQATFAGKQEACKLLWIVGSARCVPVLAGMLTDEKMGNIARYALERNADPSAGAALRTALGKAKGRALVGVISSVGDRSDAQAVGTLARFAKGGDSLVSGAAIAAMGKISTPASLAALRSLPGGGLAVWQATLRCARGVAAAGTKAPAETAFVAMASAGHPAIVRTAAAQGLIAMQSPRAASVAFSMLRDSNSRVQTAAARMCGSLADAQSTRRAVALGPGLPAAAQTALITALADRRAAAAAPLAIKLTASDDPVLRAAAIVAAKEIGGGAAVTRLAEMAANGPDQGLARDALASMPGRDAEQRLIALAQTGPSAVRAALMGVLAQRPSAAGMTAIVEAAQSSDARVAVEALRAIGRVGGVDQYAALVKQVAAAQNDQVREAALSAVASCAQRVGSREQAAGPVLAALESAPTAGKVALLDVLAQIGGDRALAELTTASASSDPEIKKAAVAALADTWADARALPTLANLAKSDPDKAIRVQALRGYIRLVGQEDSSRSDEKVTQLKDAIDIAQRPEEKRQALSVLRDCRTAAAMNLAAGLLTDPDLVAEASDAVLYLAQPVKRDNRNLPAVTGPAANAALDRVIELSKDENQRAQARKLRGQ